MSFDELNAHHEEGSVGEPLKKCPVCSGRGYFHCECWPGDCICSWGDEDCEICEATGLIYPEDEDGLFETAPTHKEAKE